jgi:hypothetical protein
MLVNADTGYTMAKDTERAAFGPGWSGAVLEKLGPGLNVGATARKDAIDKLHLLDQNRKRDEVQELEGKIQAIGGGYRKRFEHFHRQPALLEPPEIQPVVRVRVLKSSAEQLLELIGLGEKLEHDNAGTAESSAHTPSSFQQLVEAQVKLATQRAMWREARKRATRDGGLRRQKAQSDLRRPVAESPTQINTIMDLLGEGVAAGIQVIPSLRSKLPLLSGSQLPPALRATAWTSILLSQYPKELAKCEGRLRQSLLAAGAAGFGNEVDDDSLPANIPWQMLSRGLDSLVPNREERIDIEARACALLLQAQECSGNLPTGMGSLAMAIALSLPQPSLPTTRQQHDVLRPAVPERDVVSLRKSPLDQPLEPRAVALLLISHKEGLPQARTAVAHATDGTHSILKSRWPRLLKHLHSICSRVDLSDLSRRRESGQPPKASLEKIMDEEWITHGFVGALPRNALLWVWDQFALQGFHIAADLCACCFWLIRREIRGLDKASAGATELMGAMRTQLSMDATLDELQALLAGAAAKTIQSSGVGSQQRLPQVMLPMPMLPSAEEVA